MTEYEPISSFEPTWIHDRSFSLDNAWFPFESENGLGAYRMWKTGGLLSYEPRNPEHQLTTIRMRAVNTILRVAAAQSGAIEDLYDVSPGVTISIGQDRPGWRDELQNTAGVSATDHVEAQLSAYEEIRRTAPSVATASTDEHPYQLTGTWIRNLHTLLTAGQETYQVDTPVGPQLHILTRGSFKSELNRVEQRDGTIRDYCPPESTQAEMNRLVDELNGHAFRDAHPIFQAAYAHWALTHIHPFADGNGRVARAVASLYLFAWHQVPLLIFADRKAPYFQALELADAHQPFALVRYFEGRVLDTLAWLTELEREYAAPRLAADLTTLGDLVASLAGTSLENRDIAACRVRDRLFEELSQVVTQSEPSFPGSILQVRYSASYPRTGYRPLSPSFAPNADHLPLPQKEYSGAFTSWAIDFEIPAPAKVARSVTIDISVSTTADARSAICVSSKHQTPPEQELMMYLQLEDSSPTLSTATELRIRTFAAQTVSQVIRTLQTEIEHLLRTYGKDSTPIS